MMVDSHKNGNVCAVVISGNCDELPQFLKSLESVLGLNETVTAILSYLLSFGRFRFLVLEFSICIS